MEKAVVTAPRPLEKASGRMVGAEVDNDAGEQHLRVVADLVREHTVALLPSLPELLGA